MQGRESHRLIDVQADLFSKVQRTSALDGAVNPSGKQSASGALPRRSNVAGKQVGSRVGGV